jgi:hypothetical protein
MVRHGNLHDPRTPRGTIYAHGAAHVTCLELIPCCRQHRQLQFANRSVSNCCAAAGHAATHARVLPMRSVSCTVLSPPAAAFMGCCRRRWAPQCRGRHTGAAARRRRRRCQRSWPRQTRWPRLRRPPLQTTHIWVDSRCWYRSEPPHAEVSMQAAHVLHDGRLSAMDKRS